jgi:hypothetical protein
LTGQLEEPAMLVVLAALVFVDAAPEYARGRVVIAPGSMVPCGPWWTPYWAPHAYL